MVRNQFKTKKCLRVGQFNGRMWLTVRTFPIPALNDYVFSKVKY